MIKTLLDHLKDSRPDIEWVSGPDGLGEYLWDNSLPNQEEIISLVQSFVPGAPKEPGQYDLRLIRSIPDATEDEILRTPLEVLDLFIEPWIFTRGCKTIRNYRLGTTVSDPVAAFISYSYVYETGNRQIKSMSRLINWIREDGSIGLSKPIYAPNDQKTLKAINREIRQGQLDYLESEAANLRLLADTLPEPYKTQYNTVADSIDLLFVHYGTQINDYIQRGTMDFENAVLTESSPQILGILGIPVRQPDELFPNGLTVKQSIIHQLTGVVP